MTVRELMDELKVFDPDTPVHFAYPSGDHWRTTLAPAVAEVATGAVRHSSYHNENELVEDEANETPETEVVILGM